MGLYDKFTRFVEERQKFQVAGINPFGTCIDEIYSATEGRIGDKELFLPARITILA